MFPKPKTARDKYYLKWIDSQPCELRGRGPCLGDVTHHHTETGGVSLKGSDYSSISVCFGHHKVFDNVTKKGIGVFREGQLERIIAMNKERYQRETGRAINEV